MKKGGLSLVIAALVLFAGCLGDDKKAAEAGPNGELPRTTAPRATANETTGGIQGLVTTDEGLPAQGVALGLLEPPLTKATSDTLGNFSFSKLEPRTYRIAYQRFGFKDGVAEAKVTAGEITPLTIRLQAVAAEKKPYNQTKTFKGHIKYGESLLDFYTSQLDPETCDCRWEFNSSKNLKSLVLELKYTPTVSDPALDDQMWYELWTKAGWDDPDGTCLSCDYWGDGGKVIINGNWTNGEDFNLAGACDLVGSPGTELEFAL